MTYRVLLLIPESLNFTDLSQEQQAAINSVFGCFVMPMPGTESAGGFKVCDAVTADNFYPDLMPELGMDWEIIAMWYLENGFVDAVKPLDREKMSLHQTGEVSESHRWAGWPDCFDAT